MQNYFNSLSLREKLKQLGKCRLMHQTEFIDSLDYLKNKKIVIIGCGAQGLNQGLNMRDSGLNISYVLNDKSIHEKSNSWYRAFNNNFCIGSYEELIPKADLVINLTPDKQHSLVIKIIQPLMKKGAAIGYSHGFNIVEAGEQIRNDITVIMVAPKCPGTELRREYQRGFGVPTLIAVHDKNNPNHEGILLAKSWAYAIGSHKAGVLESSFVAEVKSDLIGEQTILCGMIQTGSIFCFETMVNNGIESTYACKLIQHGWEIITEALKEGGITLMMDRLNNNAKLRSYILSEHIKNVFFPLFAKHIDDIMDGTFSKKMMLDWVNNDINLLTWRKENNLSIFEKMPENKKVIKSQDYFDNCIFMVAIIKAGVELSFEMMVDSGIKSESAYYESLHELPLIANIIAKKRLYAMNMVISDTAEYGSYLFTRSALPLLRTNFVKLSIEDLGKTVPICDIDNTYLNNINSKIRRHPIELVGIKLREYMKNISIF